jgi:hypothetical protein
VQAHGWNAEVSTGCHRQKQAKANCKKLLQPIGSRQKLEYNHQNKLTCELGAKGWSLRQETSRSVQQQQGSSSSAHRSKVRPRKQRTT